MPDANDQPNQPPGATEGHASKIAATTTMLVLSLIVLLSAYAIFSLWSSSSSQPLNTGEPKPDCQNQSKVLQQGYPYHLSASTPMSVNLIGCEFPQTTVVRVNGALHGSTWLDKNRILLQLSAADLNSVGPLAVAMSDGKADFAIGAFEVVPPAFQWKFLGAGPFQITQELQLLLLVLFTGCFGSCIYACKSLADYWGSGRLCGSWMMFYYAQPLQGAGIALLVYLCVRGGFLSAGSSDIKAVNQFGVCAVAGLCGAFSDIALAKLREVFLTLFKPQDNRSDKLSAPLSITTKTLNPGRVNTEFGQSLQATGGVAPLQWSVTPNLPAPLQLHKDTGAISGLPATPAAAAEYTFIVKDAGNPPATATAKITIVINQ